MSGKVIVITSGKGGVGKTTTSANIGTALAKSGHKVVLVDTDIVGRMTKTNVSKNTQVLDSVLYVKNEDTPDKDLRLQEFNFLQIPSDVVEGDFVDVRIQFPTGEESS